MLDDPYRLDRRLREVARAWLSWRRALRRGSLDEHRFEDLGAFASTELLHELRAAGARDPLAPSLYRWAYRLYLEHATRALVIGRERAWRVERHPLSAPESGRFSLRDMLEAALADTKGTRRGFVEALASHAVVAADFELQRHERRVELVQALGDASPDALELPASDLAARARRFLDRTREPMVELGIRDVPELLEIALGRDGIASWPSRISPRSLGSLFDEAKWLHGVTLELDELPQALGASSFVRGLACFGAALSTALAPSSLPFVVAHDPWDLPGATFGALFALVPFGESFARRKLDVARARLADHRRALARSMLVAARVSALRVVLRAPTLEGATALRREYPELVFQTLGVELEPKAAAALIRSRVSDPQRFAGLALAADYRVRLEATHDEDWYRNPRAVEEVRETSRRSAETKAPKAALDRGLLELERLLTSAL